jgi:hypothetical protein
LRTPPRWPEVKLLSHYAPGFVLIIWTLLPILLRDINTYFKIQVLPDETDCLYILFTPYVWIIIGVWATYHTKPTIVLGLIGHIALFAATGNFISSSSPNGFFDGLAGLLALGLLALVVLAAIASTTVVLIAGWLVRRDVATSGTKS